MDWRYWLEPLAFWVLPVAYILFRGLRAPREGQLQRWADSYGLELTGANRSLVEWYPRRTKRFRTTGAVLGLLFSAAVVAATRGRASGSVPANGLLMAAAGYLAGAVIAEAALSRPERTLPRAASLQPRTLEQYLPGYAMWSQRIVPALAVALVPFYGALEARPFIPRTSLPRFAGTAAVIVVLAFALEVVERMVVRRAQPVVAPEVLRADEAIRSSSIHAMAGAGIALQLMGLSYQLSQLGSATSGGALNWTFGLLSILTLGLAITSWIDLGHPKSWRVQRRAWQEGRA